VEYFLKVISLLEQFPCPDLVISLAETALAICPQEHKVSLSLVSLTKVTEVILFLADYNSKDRLP
jgi:hypothetical protein